MTFLLPKEPVLINIRALFAVISFWTYSLARIWTTTIDNSLLFSTDAFFILIFLAYLKIKIFPLSKWGILFGFAGIVFVYILDASSRYTLIGATLGLSSGLTLAIITIITTYLIKLDPPERIGLYQAILGMSSSFVIACVLGFSSGWSFPTTKDLLLETITAIVFSWLLYYIWKAFYYTEEYIIGGLSYILPAFLIIAAFLLGEETINLSTGIGTLIITIGGICVVIDSHLKHKKAHHNHHN